MEKGFFFDRIDMGRAGFSVHQRIVGPFLILTDTTIAAFFISQFAETGTELTLDLTIRQFFVVSGFDPGEIAILTEGVEILEERAPAAASREAGAGGELEEISSLHLLIKWAAETSAPTILIFKCHCEALGRSNLSVISHVG